MFGSSTLGVLDPELLLGLHILRDILYRNMDMKFYVIMHRPPFFCG
jgi:hypothetical protein